jgi:hypothetical protein
MTTQTIHDTARNGRNINTTVTLLWHDNEPFAERPFIVETSVDWTRMAHSHHKTNQQAKREAGKMHAAYLKTHSR